MKRWISSILFAFLATVLATWMAIANEPVEQAPVRLLAPIAIEDDEPTAPSDEDVEPVAARQVVQSESHGFPQARSANAGAKAAPRVRSSDPTPAREPLFAHLYRNWGKPKSTHGPSATETRGPSTTESYSPTPTEQHGAITNEQIARSELDRLREDYVRPSISQERAIVHLPDQDETPADVEAAPSGSARQVAASSERDERRFAGEQLVREALAEPAPPEMTLGDIPRDSTLWWESLMEKRLRRTQQPLPVNIDLLTVGTLEHAPQIESLKSPSEFRIVYFDQPGNNVDWHSLWNACQVERLSPVEATQDTASKCLSDVIRNRIRGIKQPNVAASDQQPTHDASDDNESIQIALSCTQPLVDKAERAYSYDRIAYAQMQQESFAETSNELNQQLGNTVEAYWNLYAARAACLQQQKVLSDAENIVAMLNRNQDIGLGNRQVLRAETAAANRRSELIRAEVALRNAESRLRTLVNDPRLTQFGELELIPLEAPTRDQMSLSVKESLQSAAVHRAEIVRAAAHVRATGQQLGIDDEELLPAIEQVISTRIAELARGNVVDLASKDDRTIVTPGGNETLIALGRLAPGLINDRKQREWAATMQDFRTTLHTELKKVETLVRESDTLYQEMVSRYEVLKAAHVEANYLEDQFRFQPGTQDAAVSLLEDLLKAQDSRANAERRFVESQMAYVLSFTHARQAAGSLVQEVAGIQSTKPLVQ
ncbi:MAG: TolC family protein [Planctomycetaceae bacterium]|nr:TolC family protein [Planctomycetaceae bacterium]